VITGARGFVAAHLAQLDAPRDVGFHLVPGPDLFRHERPGEMLDLSDTIAAIQRARSSGVRRLVLMSTAAVLRPCGRFARTAAAIERLVARAPLETVIVRPACLWGAGDDAFMPGILHAVRGRHYAWIDGGRYAYATCHVRNACEAALLAAEHGLPGRAYLVRDREPTTFHSFVSGLLRAHGVRPPLLSIPYAAAAPAAACLERLWTMLRLTRAAPITREILALYGMEVDVCDRRARAELGYVGRVTRAAGLAELSAGQQLASPV